MKEQRFDFSDVKAKLPEYLTFWGIANTLNRFLLADIAIWLFVHTLPLSIGILSKKIFDNITLKNDFSSFMQMVLFCLIILFINICFIYIGAQIDIRYKITLKNLLYTKVTDKASSHWKEFWQTKGRVIDSLNADVEMIVDTISYLVALAVGAMVGFLNGTIIYKTGLPPFIVTYSLQSICQGIAYVWTGAQPIRLTDQNFIFLGAGYAFGVIPMPLIYLGVILVFVWYILNRTKLGRHIYAVGGNEKAAEFSGVNIRKVRWFVYIFSGIMAALAGVVLSARMYSGQPAVGAGGEMDAIAAVVLGGTSMGGGRGSIGGTIIGALLIGILNNGLNLAGIDSYWQMVAKGAIILIAVYVDFVKQGNKLRK